MKGKGALALLLVTAGGLIYAATNQPREPAPPPRPAAAKRVVAHRAPDQLAWLGRVPANFTDEKLTRRVDRVLAKMRHDVATGQDTSSFVCKLPAEVGPVPMLDAVDDYLRGLPGSRADPAVMARLHTAAAQGNWLARVQVYLMLSERHAPDDATAFRTLKLMEWMQERRIGALYGAVSDTLAASDYRGDPPGSTLTSLDIYAAMHHNYPSQYKVGRELLRSGDAQRMAVGRRMLECAAQALPAYGRLYGDAAVAARQ